MPDVRTHTTCECGAESVRDYRSNAGESVCENGHVTRWAVCNVKVHAAHDWRAGHCHGQGLQSSAFILWGGEK